VKTYNLYRCKPIFQMFPHIPIYATCIALASIPTTHLLQDRQSRPSCGGACLAGRPPTCASSATLSLLVQAIVHCRPLSMVIWLSHLPALLQCRPIPFSGWSSNVEWTCNRSKPPPKWCLFSIPPPSQDCSFPLGLGRERFWVGVLKGCYINFDWLIDLIEVSDHRK